MTGENTFAINEATASLVSSLEESGFTVTENNRQSIRRVFARCRDSPRACILALGIMKQTRNTGRLIALWHNRLSQYGLL